MRSRFSTLLVANRGEIACRVLRAARAEGLRAIAVYSDADADAAHVRLADAAVRIGPAPPAQSYLQRRPHHRRREIGGRGGRSIPAMVFSPKTPISRRPAPTPA